MPKYSTLRSETFEPCHLRMILACWSQSTDLRLAQDLAEFSRLFEMSWILLRAGRAQDISTRGTAHI